MAIKLGTIQVDLIANTVSFSGAMEKAAQISLNSSKNIQRSLTMISAAATAMAASVVASLTAAVTKAEDFAFTMSKFAEKTGNSVEMMSKLAYSAKLAGVPIDMVKGAMERLARTSGAAQSGQKEAISAYTALGISVKDLHGPLSNSGDLLIAVSKKLATMGDSTRKTYLEQKLLGRTGSELAPMLSTLGASFEKNSKEAEMFGVVLDEATAEKAKALHVTIAQLESVMMGFSVRLLSGVAPALSEVGGNIIRLVTSADGLKTVAGIASSLSSIVRGLGAAFEFLFTHATAVKMALGGLATLQVGSIFLPMISGAAKAGTGFDTLGLSAVKMIGKMLGITQIAAVMGPLTAATWGYASALIGLAKTETFAAVGSLALSDAMAFLNRTLLANPYVAIAAAILGIGTALYRTSAAALATEPDGGKWSDTWNASITNVSRNTEVLTAKWKKFRGEALDATDQAALKRGFNAMSQGDMIREAGQQRRDAADFLKPKAPTADLSGVAGVAKPKALLDAPTIDKVGTPKLDIVEKKLLDLRNAAEASRKALEDAGKGPSFERADEAAKEAKKTIDDLNVSLKVHGKSLTESQKAQITADIATAVNNNSQAEYRKALLKTTEELLGQASAQDVLTHAIGAGAAAVRDAAVASYSQKQDAGKDSEWLQKNAAMRAARDKAYRDSLDANNTNTDDAALEKMGQEFEAQTRLNAAYGKGKDALDAVTLANQQAAISADFASRGDTDSAALQMALDTNRAIFDLKQKGADLQRTAQFNPSQVYADQVKSINDVVDAAKEAGIALNDLTVEASRKSAWDEYINAVDRVKLSVGGLKDVVSVVFGEIGRSTENAGQQIHDVLQNSISSLNDTLTDLMTGQQASFERFFRGIASQVAKLGLQFLEASAVNAAQPGKKQDAGSLLSGVFGGSKKGGSDGSTVAALQTSNSLLQQIATNTSGSVGTGGSMSSLLPDAKSDSSDVGKAFGLTSSLLGSLSSFIPGAGLFTGLFGGHRALGGDVKAGMTYDVGEMGRETFTPTQDGKITPNNKMSGNSYYSISVPNGVTPEQFHQTMQQMIPHIKREATASAVHAITERERRRPATAGR